MSEEAKQEGLLLPGLDGTNPLGFMAALGVLRVLNFRFPEVQLRWTLSAGTWRPVFHGVQVEFRNLGEELHSAIHQRDHAMWSLDKRLPFDATVLRKRVVESVCDGTKETRQYLDDLSSLGVECFTDKEGLFERTSLCMVRSGDSSRQGLLAYGKRIIETTTATQIQTAIGGTWLNIDEKCALRWDPAEDRPYANQWRNPSDGGATSEKGGVCLALFAMPYFTAVPVKGHVETTGFGLKEAKQTSMTWPIWTYPINLPTVASLLSIPELHRKQPSRKSLAAMGVESVYRCNRVMTSKYYSNFTPPLQIT